MQARELELPALPARIPDLVFRTPCNWTCVLFFGCLGLLHLTIATLAFFHGRFEAYLSMVLGMLFIGVSIVAQRCRFEMAIQPCERRIRLRSGTRTLHYQRFIAFTSVHGIRLTQPARLEVLCENEDIECPPTVIPREEALCLAVLMGVRLIKVSDEEQENRI